MRLIVNGKPVELPEGASVEALIAHLGLQGAICAAEVNQTLVPKRERASRTLHDGDRVEIVTLVGGG